MSHRTSMGMYGEKVDSVQGRQVDNGRHLRENQEETTDLPINFDWIQCFTCRMEYFSKSVIARGTLFAGFERWRRWRSCRGQIISDMAYEHLICTRCVTAPFVSSSLFCDFVC